jgi:hypothetical protein
VSVERTLLTWLCRVETITAVVPLRVTVCSKVQSQETLWQAHCSGRVTMW